MARHTRIRVPHGTCPSKKSGTTINQPRVNKRLNSTKKTLLILYLILYFHADLLDREEGEEDYRPSEESEAEAMRLLELEPTDQDDRQAEKNAEAGGAGTNTASVNAAAGETGGAGTAPPASGGGAASSNAASTAPRDSGSGKKTLGPGPSEVNSKKRDRSPTDSEDLQSSRSSRRGSGSSFSSLSFRQKSYLPALYYSTQNKRDSATKPRILGGGRKFLLLRGV